MHRRGVVHDGEVAAVRLEGARHPGVADEQVQLRAAVGEGGAAAAPAAEALVAAVAAAGAAQEVAGLALRPETREHTDKV